MNKTETAKLLTIASMIDNRTVATETVEAWHMVVGHIDFDLAQEAMNLHWRESTEYLIPAHITKNLPRVRMKIETDVRSAKARHLIGADWPAQKALTPDLQTALRDARSESGDAAAAGGYPSLTAVANQWMNPRS